jgi:nucleolar protein 56
MGPVKDKKVLHTTWYGSFLISIKNESSRVIHSIKAEMDPERIADDLHLINTGKILDRERTLSDKENINSVTDVRLLPLIGGSEVIEIRSVDVPSPQDLGFSTKILSEATILLSEMSAGEGPDDSAIMSGVGALTDIDSSLNLMTERMREWYCKYWEAVSPLLEEREVLELISEDPEPVSLHTRLNREDIDPPKGEAPELEGISALSRLCISLWDSRELMEKYLETEMGVVAPCLSDVVGPLIGARLIHSAGGLSRLAKLPSSTVQVLGAEKMFFKFLKEGGKPPKHGVLFQHPWVHSLPVSKRGKMSRALANAASIASRIDAFGSGDPAPLKERLDRRRDEILKKDEGPRRGGGRQPPFREGWWADKPLPKKGRGRRSRGRGKRK